MTDQQPPAPDEVEAIQEACKGHTPGPWFVKELPPDTGGCREIDSPKGQVFWTVGYYIDEQDEANANLCAAAPTLLLALDAAVAERDEARDDARANAENAAYWRRRAEEAEKGLLTVSTPQVLLRAERDEARRELAELRAMKARLEAPTLIDKFAEVAHRAYCAAYLAHKGEPYWTKGDYSKLDDTYKGYDRSMAEDVIDAYRRAVLGGAP